MMVVLTLLATVAATLGAPAPAGAAVALSCSPDPGKPYPVEGGSAVGGSGLYECNKSVAYIDITVTLERDGLEVWRDSWRATRRPGGQLVNALIIFSTNCATSGSYRVTTAGSAPGAAYRGSASAEVYINCAVVV